MKLTTNSEMKYAFTGHLLVAVVRHRTASAVLLSDICACSFYDLCAISLSNIFLQRTRYSATGTVHFRCKVRHLQTAVSLITERQHTWLMWGK
jgi:hypothetical protein